VAVLVCHLQSVRFSLIKKNKDMASCEKCWYDAYELQDCEENHYETYNRLIKERKDNPCSEIEQAGQFWDEERKVDTRKE